MDQGLNNVQGKDQGLKPQHHGPRTQRSRTKRKQGLNVQGQGWIKDSTTFKVKTKDSNLNTMDQGHNVQGQSENQELSVQGQGWIKDSTTFKVRTKDSSQGPKTKR